MNDYTVDIGGWISRGFENTKNNWGPLVGFSALALILLIILAFLGGAIGSILALMITNMIKGGMQNGADPLINYVVYTIPTTLLSVILQTYFIGALYSGVIEGGRGQKVSFGRLVQLGAEKYLTLLPYFAFLGLFGLILGGLFLPAEYVLQSNPVMALPIVGILLAAALVVFLIVAPIAYTPFMVLDGKGGLLSCLTGSFNPFYKHYFMNILYLILVMIISGLGALLCCVGIFFTMPLSYAMIAAAYEDIYKEA